MPPRIEFAKPDIAGRLNAVCIGGSVVMLMALCLGITDPYAMSILSAPGTLMILLGAPVFVLTSCWLLLQRRFSVVGIRGLIFFGPIACIVLLAWFGPSFFD